MDLLLAFDPTTRETDVVRDAYGARWRMTDGLETAVILSLFCDRRADEADELPDPDGDRRGWWADGELGSRLWLLERSKVTTETVAAARDYAREALDWLLDEGIAASVDVVASVPRRGWIGLEITITRAGAPPAQFAYVWEL